MVYSQEQEVALEKEDSFCVNATAGSGKTTTICSWANFNGDRKMLALAYNRNARENLKKIKNSLGVDNLDCETPHSLAYKTIFKVGEKPDLDFSITSTKIVEYLKLEDLPGMSNSCYAQGRWISTMFQYYLSSTVPNFSGLRPEMFPDFCNNEGFINNFSFLKDSAEDIFRLMKDREIPILHDFYLREYWEGNYPLLYDAILFDEGQDATPIMLDIFLRQDNILKVIVGDEHQQIYSWRHAVNSLESTGLEKLYLTNCFRFNDKVAETANQILKWKNVIGRASSTPDLVGARFVYPDPFPEKYGTAIIARTNMGLLNAGISLIDENHPHMNSIFFEGNFDSYAFNENGDSISDVYNCFLNKRHEIKSNMIKNMRSFNELKEYSEMTNDNSLQVQIDLVEKYKGKLLGLLKTLSKRNAEHRDKAEMIFTTAHRAKGMEYDEVAIVDDFNTIQDLKQKIEQKQMSISRAAEEINLLYVAVTRSRGTLLMKQNMINSLSY